MSAPNIAARIAVAGVALVVLVLVVTALLPRTVDVERDVVIDRPAADVFDDLRPLKHEPAARPCMTWDGSRRNAPSSGR